MPRYYFHLRDGQTRYEDVQGQELADSAAARLVARANARDMGIVKLRINTERDHRTVEIADATGSIIDTRRLRQPETSTFHRDFSAFAAAAVESYYVCSLIGTTAVNVRTRL